MKKIVKNNFKKISYGALFIELTGIVFAVLFALAVDEWNQDNEHQELAQKVMKSVQLEINDNKNDLIPHLLTNSERVNNLNALLEKFPAGDAPFSEIKAQWGISLPNLRATAWDSVLLTNSVTRIDLKKIEMLSGIYKQQKDFNEYANYLVRNFGELSGKLSQGQKVALNIHMINLTTLISLGSSLKRSYQKFQDYEGDSSIN